MKVKKFNNLWAMGLILFVAILIAFYIAKIFFPQFIVGVAEIPSIVAFGNYIDSHLWAYYLFDGIISFISAFIYVCACLRKSKLSIKSIISIIIVNCILYLFSAFAPLQYMNMNYVSFLFMPFICGVLDKAISKETFISTSICFCIDITAQVFSMFIRDITTMAVQFNSATFLILLIDGLIWRFLLYSYFNYKNKKENK